MDDQNVKLLIVDDEEDIRKKLALWLRKKDYEVQTAGDGRIACEILGSYDAQILITDLKMPKVGGLELIKEALVMKPNIGIIVITGHGDVDTYIETFSMGVFEFLNKPFGLDDLEAVLKKLIKKIDRQ